MTELVIPIREYIGDSRWDWEKMDMEWATNANDVRMAVEYAQYQGISIDSIRLDFGTCYGGSVFAGLEIYNYLKSLEIPIKARIMGMVASMGTLIPLVADEIEVDQSVMFMVHGPSGGADGTVTALRSALTSLESYHETLRDIYVTRTGQPVEVVEEWMSKDTWFKAEEALALGLCTKVIPLTPRTAPVLTEAQATLRKERFASIVARADKRAIAARKKPVPVAAHPRKPTPIRPMAKNATAPKAGTKKAAPTAAEKANMKILNDLAKQFGLKATFSAEAEEVTVVAESTETDQEGALLYHDGPLAQGSAVFYDEALTEPADDGVYGLADGRSITVAAGIVESIEEANASASIETEANSNAGILRRLQALEDEKVQDRETIASLNTELAKFKKITPPTPSGSARRPAPQVDTKNTSNRPKPTAAHHSTL